MSDDKIFTLENIPDLVGIDMARRLQEAGLSADEAIEGAEQGHAFATALVEATTHPDDCQCDLHTSRCSHGFLVRETCPMCDADDPPEGQEER